MSKITGQERADARAEALVIGLFAVVLIVFPNPIVGAWAGWLLLAIWVPYVVVQVRRGRLP